MSFLKLCHTQRSEGTGPNSCTRFLLRFSLQLWDLSLDNIGIWQANVFAVFKNYVFHPVTRCQKRDEINEIFQTWFGNNPADYKDIYIQVNELYCNVNKRIKISSTKAKVTKHLNIHISYSDDDYLYKIFSQQYSIFLIREKLINKKVAHESMLRRGNLDQVYKLQSN